MDVDCNHIQTHKDASVVLEPEVDLDFGVMQDVLFYSVIGFVVAGLGITMLLPKPVQGAVASTTAEQQGLMMKDTTV